MRKYAVFRYKPYCDCKSADNNFYQQHLIVINKAV